MRRADEIRVCLNGASMLGEEGWWLGLGHTCSALLIRNGDVRVESHLAKEGRF